MFSVRAKDSSEDEEDKEEDVPFHNLEELVNARPDEETIKKRKQFNLELDARMQHQMGQLRKTESREQLMRSNVSLASSNQDSELSLKSTTKGMLIS